MKRLLLPISLSAIAFCTVLPSLAFADTSENYEKALSAFNQEEFSESYIHLKNALQASPSHLPSKLLMGRVLLVDGYVNDAITEFEEVMAAGADLNLVVVPLANAYLISRRFDALIDLPTPRSLSSSIKLDVQLLKAAAHIQKKELEQAKSIYESAQLEFGQNSNMLNGLAQISLIQKSYAEANQYLDKALSVEPNNAKSVMLRGLVLQSQGQSDEARKQFELAYQFDEFDPTIKRALANSYVEANMLSKAEEMITLIEEQTSGDLQTQLLKARVLAMQEKSSEADALLAQLNQMLSLATDENKEQTGWISLVAGITAYINKNYEVTVRELSRYVKSGSAPPELLGMLAEAHIRQGDSKKAMALLELNESIVLESIPVSSLLCDLYLASNKVFKCNNLIEELKQEYGANHTVILLEAKLLVRRDRVDEALALLSNSNLDTNAEDVLLFKATLEANNQRYADALVSANTLVELQPDNLKYQNLHADLNIRLGNFQQATTALNNVLLADPLNVAALMNLSRVQFAQQALPESRQTIEKVIAQQGTNIPALVLHAQILIKQQKLEEAIETLLMAKAAAPNKAAPHELLANIYRQQQKYAIALTEVNALLKIDRLNSAYIFEKANLLIALNEPQQAKSQLDILFGQWSDNAARLVELSQVQRQAKDVNGAKLSLQRATSIAPQYALAKLEYGQLLISQGSLPEAKALIESMQKDFSNNPNVYVLQGNYFKAVQDIDSAYNAYSQAVTLKPDFTLPLIELYQIASQGPQKEAFKEYLSNHLSKNDDAHFQRHLLADLLYIEGNMPAAEVQYLKLISINGLPNKDRIYNNLALIKAESEPKQGLEYAEIAAQLTPDSAAILDTKGWLLVKNAQYQEALTTLRTAFTMRSSDPSIRYHLAAALTGLGKAEQAKSELTQALASTSPFPEKQQAEALLKTL
ncbi:PEP-CTERM system TPR-repeat protein PrsT [Paraglaciecola chathamensis]|uniref:PEP-CTERM system TPR-repeat protein PrsT n=1 Tax=Paraglaciecola chathamensis TaxID=368405 RepID=A0ABS0WA51_9ALTE|nr:XrtA/PEP-CTERM system TPR-repeat protein PrsT [Paraglaciecola chathamensis]MBJ2134827.1 PEP-CTERM system TPR-repeat protein PrsT [Paraglaciecola chathamensis]